MRRPSAMLLFSVSTRCASRSSASGVRKSWLDGIEASRKNPKHRSDVEHGPWSAREAKEHGLIDEIGFESDALDDVKKRTAQTARAPILALPAPESNPTWAISFRILAGGDERSAGRPHIAVVVAEGEITMSAGGMFSSGGITEGNTRCPVASSSKSTGLSDAATREHAARGHRDFALGDDDGDVRAPCGAFVATGQDADEIAQVGLLSGAGRADVEGLVRSAPARFFTSSSASDSNPISSMRPCSFASRALHGPCLNVALVLGVLARGFDPIEPRLANARGAGAARPPGRNAEQRHRAEAAHHRRPAAVDAQQPRPGGDTRDPGARFREADQRRGASCARARRTGGRAPNSWCTGWCRKRSPTSPSTPRPRKSGSAWRRVATVGGGVGARRRRGLRHHAQAHRPTAWWACAFASRPKAGLTCSRHRARAR